MFKCCQKYAKNSFDFEYVMRNYSKRVLIRLDLKIRWFAVTRLGLQETCESKIFFDVHY